MRLKVVARCAISLGLIFLVFRKVDWPALGAVFYRLDFRWAGIASASTFVLIISLTFRWRIFLRQQEILLPFSEILSLTWAGQFFNTVLPGSTGGDVIKIYQLCRRAPNKRAAAAATVFVDRLSALAALLVLAFGAFAFAPTPALLPVSGAWWTRSVILACIVGLLLAIPAAFIAVHLLRSSAFGMRVVRTFQAAKRHLLLGKQLAVAVLCSFAIHLLNFLIAYLFARALGLSITYAQVLIMMPVILLLIMLPLTINGHGLREILLVSYFTSFHLSASGSPSSVATRDLAVAFSLLLVANDLLWSLPGGLWHLVSRNLPRNPEL